MASPQLLSPVGPIRLLASLQNDRLSLAVSTAWLINQL
jgi:hypothetical protein